MCCCRQVHLEFRRWTSVCLMCPFRFQWPENKAQTHIISLAVIASMHSLMQIRSSTTGTSLEFPWCFHVVIASPMFVAWIADAWGYALLLVFLVALGAAAFVFVPGLFSCWFCWDKECRRCGGPYTGGSCMQAMVSIRNHSSCCCNVHVAGAIVEETALYFWLTQPK